MEWSRIIKPGGYIILAVPNKHYCFDRARPDTCVQHMIEDYFKSTTEDDTTHVAEILSLHDRSMDPGLSGTTLEERARLNTQLRSLHHHVFTQQSLRQLGEYIGLESVTYFTVHVNHIHLFRKNSTCATARNLHA